MGSLVPSYRLIGRSLSLPLLGYSITFVMNGGSMKILVGFSRPLSLIQLQIFFSIICSNIFSYFSSFGSILLDLYVKVILIPFSLVGLPLIMGQGCSHPLGPSGG